MHHMHTLGDRHDDAQRHSNKWQPNDATTPPPWWLAWLKNDTFTTWKCVKIARQFCAEDVQHAVMILIQSQAPGTLIDDPSTIYVVVARPFVNGGEFGGQLGLMPSCKQTRELG
jgi:hypothetical protein